MRKINWFYIAIIVLIPFMVWLLRPESESDVAFFGFAENLETEINYNYDVVIDEILVSPGQMVKKGTSLLKISRRKSKEELEDKSFQISTLQAEERAWRRKKQNELELIFIIKEEKELELNAKIVELEQEIAYKKTLVSKSGFESEATYNPLQEQLIQYQQSLANVIKLYDKEIATLKEEITLGSNPYKTRIDELEAEIQFDAEHKIQNLEVLAPEEGLIGNIFCKEAEHIPAFKTLMTFYEPHSGIIKGYVHEDLTMNVEIGELFDVSSLKFDSLIYEGKVIGLGSRIVEIPERLRKFPQIKNYGREISIEITKENVFLQKEKVGLKLKTQNQ